MLVHLTDEITTNTFIVSPSAFQPEVHWEYCHGKVQNGKGKQVQLMTKMICHMTPGGKNSRQKANLQ